MDFSNIQIMALMKAKMGYDSQNQDILSQNIANADTPGYKAKEMKKVDFENMAMAASHRLQMVATSPEHVFGPHAHEGAYDVKKQKKTFETKTVKNNISVEEQMAQVAYNNVDYTTVTDLYRKTAGLFKTALGKQS